jgi:hypothetical protein
MATSRNYFQKFPAISYNDYVVRDISVRAKLTQYLQETGLALLPYTIKEGERADSISAFYYEDPYYAWAIYLVNGILDPYSEWPKTSQTLDQYVIDTYGSVEEAQDQILYYEVDWASDTTLLSVDQYNALPLSNKKYWESQAGYNGEIINYFRRELDWTADNNRIDQITVISNSSVNSLVGSFEVGERVYQYNYLNDIAVESTVISVDTTTDANTIPYKYTNSTFYDVTFTNGNSTITVKSASQLLPKAKVSGTNIPANTYIEAIVSGTHVRLSAAPTGAPAANSTYSFMNPAHAKITVQKVDFSDVIFSSNATLATPNAFFTYSTAGAYQDVGNYLIGRKNDANVVVLTHTRLDTNVTANALLSNSRLTNEELVYWKPVNAYEYEVLQNEKRKEIFVLDRVAINTLDNNLEAIVKNV